MPAGQACAVQKHAHMQGAAEHRVGVDEGKQVLCSMLLDRATTAGASMESAPGRQLRSL